MPKNFEPYNLEEAQEEAKRIKDVVGPKSTSEDYTAAHDLVEKENFVKAKQEIKSYINSYLRRLSDSHYRRRSSDYLKTIQNLREKFGIPAGEVEADPELQEAARKLIKKRLKYGDLREAEELKSNLFVPDEIYTLPEFQEAAKKGVIYKIEDYVGSFLPSDKDLQEASDIKRKFNIDDQSFAQTSHVLILNNLKSGNVNNVVKIQKVFSISDEKLLSPEYVALAEQALVSNFERGNKDNIEKIREKFLPNLDTTEFVRNQYQGYIS